MHSLPGKPYRVCFWATTFQADMHSFARYLDTHPDYRVLIATEDPGSFRQEGLHTFLPISAPLIDARSRTALLRVSLFRPHVLVIDNHFPPFIRPAKRLLVLWHGVSWRRNRQSDFVHVHNGVERIAGSGRRPNPRFIWQCEGPEVSDYWDTELGFARENLRLLGPAQSDDLVNVRIAGETDTSGTGTHTIPRSEVASYYDIDIMKRPTVLCAFTWHHGQVLGHWGNDLELFRELLEYGDELGVNFIIRMHDRFRYDQSYLSELENLIAGQDHVMLKFKDAYRDNLFDMLVADVMISNYSSILRRFYYTGKPSLHIYPVKDGTDQFTWRRVGEDGSLVEETLPDDTFLWKFPPEMIGGIQVRSMEELKRSLAHALAHPNCCRELSEQFIEEHMAGTAGHNCAHTERELRALITRSDTTASH